MQRWFEALQAKMGQMEGQLIFPQHHHGWCLVDQHFVIDHPTFNDKRPLPLNLPPSQHGTEIIDPISCWSDDVQPIKAHLDGHIGLPLPITHRAIQP